jgi:glyoxylate/succinic semialdehyde reductase
VPLLDVMGKAHFFLGDVGQGAQMKLVVNMVRLTITTREVHGRRCLGTHWRLLTAVDPQVMGSMMAAFGEGLELANKSGLSQVAAQNPNRGFVRATSGADLLLPTLRSS